MAAAQSLEKLNRHLVASPHPLLVLQPGIIKRVRMRNLRVHKEVSLELHPRLNFIIGANGSGKSSILTAIRLATGLRVDTRSLRAFRRTGEHKAATASSGKTNSAGTHDSVEIGTVIRTGSDGETIAEIDISNEGMEADCLPHAIWGDKFIRLRRTLKVGHALR